MPPTVSKEADERVKRTTIWFDAEIKRQAEVVVAEEGKGQGYNEAIEEEARAGIAKRYKKVVSRAAAELGEAGA